jgi:hypothetical protein
MEFSAARREAKNRPEDSERRRRQESGALPEKILAEAACFRLAATLAG